MQSIIRYIVFGLFIGISVVSYGQKDREFWFAVPEVTNSHADRPIYINVVAQSRECEVTIDIPANPSFKPINVDLDPFEFARIDLTNWINQLENTQPETILNRGLHVLSTDLITAFYETNGISAFSGRVVNTDIFSLKGSNALGTEFLVPFQTSYRNQDHDIPAYSSFDIVATEDNTQITIVPSKNTASHTQNTPFTITLNKGQTYSVRAAGFDPQDHLSGSHVESDKPICITVKDDSVILPNDGSNDLVGDQIVPVEKLGNEFIVKGGMITILATRDSTEIEFGGVLHTTLDSAETYDYEIPGSQTILYITTSEPIYLQQILDFGNETGGALIPHVACTGSYDITFSRGTTELLRLLILVRDGNQGNFTLDGQTGSISPASFVTVPGAPNWVMADIGFNSSQLSVGAHRIQNSDSPFHLGVENGDQNTGFRYGYFSNFNLLELGIDIDACSGSILDAGTGKDSYLWSTGDTTPTIEIDTSGTYWALITEDGCVASDTINAIIRPGITVSLPEDTILCLGDSILLIPEIDGMADTILWNGSILDSVFKASAGSSVNVIVRNSFKCSDSDVISIGEVSGQGRQIPLDTIVCEEAFTLELNPENNYIWENANGDTISTTSVISANSSGEYYLTISGKCAPVTDSVSIEFRNVRIPNIITPNGDGLNECFTIDGISVGNWEFDLYNRWGKRVLRTTQFETLLQNSHLPEGMYYYGLKDENCDVVYKGWVEIVR